MFEGIGSLIGYFVLLYVIGAAIEWCGENRDKITTCKHGVFGGKARNCMNCVKEKEIELQLRADEEKRALLKQQVSGHRAQQIEQLKNSQYQKIDFLRELSPQQFEDVIAEMYVALGYKVNQTPYTNDGGKDAIAYKGGKKYLIECKRYAADNKVGRPALQKFFAAIVEENAERGFFVTSGFFADTADEYARKSKIELINGTDLISLMRKAYPENNSDGVSIMCPQCGELIQFNMNEQITVKKCKHGHEVENTIEYKDLFHWNRKRRKKW